MSGVGELAKRSIAITIREWEAGKGEGGVSGRG